MSGEKLEVVILTYNRAGFLREQLTSVCESTLDDFLITILNNASTDNTIDVVKEIQSQYPNRNINLITNTKNIGNFGNFKKAQTIASRDYVCVLHDDDVLNPYYLEKAMQFVTDDPEVVLVTGLYCNRFNPGIKDWYIKSTSIYVYPPKLGAFISLSKERFCFQCAFYKTDIYKKVQIRCDDFGKCWDISFLCDIQQMGKSAVMQFECIKTRIHFTQHSNNNSDGPFDYELLSQLKYLSGLLKEYEYQYFWIYTLGKTLFNWGNISNISFVEFLKKMVQYRIISRFQYLMLKHTKTKHIIEKLSKHYVKKYSKQKQEIRF